MRAHNLIALSLTFSALISSEARAQNYYWKESSGARATYVYRYSVTLPQCTVHTFKTWDLSPGADTVMWITQGTTELAWNDDFLGLKSQINYSTSCGGGDQTVIVWVRAKSNATGGTGGHTFEFIHNSTNLGEHRLGGYILKSGNVTYSTDTVETILVNDGAAATQILRFTWDGTHYRYNGRDTSSGVGLASKLAGSSASDEQWVIATYVESWREGPVRVARNNNATSDTDLDGLGNGLENEACTCPYAYTTTCNGEYSCGGLSQDTDGDGLTDTWEVIGVDHTDCGGPGQEVCDPLLFPLWGASATRKDIFVEVDRGSSNDPVFTETQAVAASGKYSSFSSLQNPAGSRSLTIRRASQHICCKPMT